MSTDYIYAWPSNPIDNPQADCADKMIEEIDALVRTYLAEDLPQALDSAISEAMKDDYAPPTGWEHYYDTHFDQIKEALYDDIYNELKKIWER